MSKARLALAGAAVIASLPLTTNDARSDARAALCRTSEPPLEGVYPTSNLSPMQSYKQHDAVFLAEVVVPSRPCSLGHCAGLRIKRRLKGEIETNALVQVLRPKENPCGPKNFTKPGQTWIVFANRGTSRTGFAYFFADDEGPSFPAQGVPNFQMMESHYIALRLQLDRAIETTLGPVHVNAETNL